MPGKHKQLDHAGLPGIRGKKSKKSGHKKDGKKSGHKKGGAGASKNDGPSKTSTAAPSEPTAKAARPPRSAPRAHVLKPARIAEIMESDQEAHPVRIPPSKIEDAIKLLGEGKKVEFEQLPDVAVFLDKLAEVADEAMKPGGDKKTYDLCGVTVKGSNLFCAESKGIGRIRMPQLSGTPVAGSKAAGMKANKKGQVDLTKEFVKFLKARGIKSKKGTEKAANLRPSQHQLRGEKIAGMARAMKTGEIKEATLIVSRDNYIVDGHHRWAAKVGLDAATGVLGDVEQSIERIDIDILRLLAAANRFTEEWGIPHADFSLARLEAWLNEPSGSRLPFAKR